MKKHILVTGGAGFIGSNLINALLENYKVTAIDNFDSCYSRQKQEYNLMWFHNNPNFSFLEGDIRNFDDLLKIPNIDAIIHLAAKTGVRASLKNQSIYQDVNINGTKTLLEFAKYASVKQFIFASSSSVYGINTSLPWNEESQLVPISPYAKTKISGEMLGTHYSKYGIRFLSLRFFTVYGPGQRPDLAIHRFFKAILANQSIPVYGDGSSSRDYTFITDIVNGIMAAIEYDKSPFEIINLGNSRNVTLIELIKMIEAVCGKTAIIDFLSEQPGDVPHTFANISKANELLDYNNLRDLESGLQEFYRWYMLNPVNPKDYAIGRIKI